MRRPCLLELKLEPDLKKMQSEVIASFPIQETGIRPSQRVRKFVICNAGNLVNEMVKNILRPLSMTTLKRFDVNFVNEKKNLNRFF